MNMVMHELFVSPSYVWICFCCYLALSDPALMYYDMIVGRYHIHKAPLNLSNSAAVCLHLARIYMLQMFDVDQQLHMRVSSISAALNSPGARWPQFWRVTRVSDPSPSSLHLKLRYGRAGPPREGYQTL